MIVPNDTPALIPLEAIRSARVSPHESQRTTGSGTEHERSVHHSERR